MFYDDPKRPNRYLLARESSSRPDATNIEVIHIFITLMPKDVELIMIVPLSCGSAA